MQIQHENRVLGDVFAQLESENRDFYFRFTHGTVQRREIIVSLDVPFIFVVCAPPPVDRIMARLWNGS